MTKKISILFILTMILSSLTLAVNCPSGLVNDSYPSCGLYKDTNTDHVCDLSQEQQANINLQNNNQQITQTNEAIITYSVASENIFSNLFKTRRYNFLGVSIILLLIYSISFLLSRFNKITVITHRKIWNLMLLITFLVSAILGIFLVIQINYGIIFRLPFNMLYWHVEAGIAMTIISIFHIIWHWKYYLTILKRNKNITEVKNNKKKKK